MLIVESLFRFEDKTIKDAILCNYQEQNEEVEAEDVGEYQDDNQGDDF